jgi:Domain of unknown function (DUF6457)
MWRMNEFLEQLGGHWVVAAERRGAPIAAPTVDSRVALELLELARVAAHTHERRFAPLSCYLAGVAAERLRMELPGTDASVIAGFIEEVRHVLEGDST